MGIAKDYKKTKIYRLVCNTTKLQYIGHTAQTYLSSRKALHVYNYKKFIINGNKRHFCTSFEILKNDNWDIYLIEEYPCDNNEQARQREQYWQDKLECVNKHNSYVSEEQRKLYDQKRWKQYNENHKDEIKQKRKEHYESNKDELKQKRKEYYESHKDEENEKGRNHYHTHKEYYQQHWQEYYDNHKDEINEKRKERIKCECGIDVPRRHLSTHTKTNKHLKLINKKISLSS